MLIYIYIYIYIHRSFEQKDKKMTMINLVYVIIGG